MNKTPKLDVQFVAVFYFIFFMISFVLDTFRGVIRFNPKGPGQLLLILASLSVGVVLGYFILGMSALSVRYIKSFQELSSTLYDMIGNVSRKEAFILAIFSSVSEEFFFRGILQAYIGLIPAALVFGFLHSGPNKKYRVWTLFAVVSGLLFGAVYQLTGDLFAPIAAHFVVNFMNLQWLEGSSIVKEE